MHGLLSNGIPITAVVKFLQNYPVFADCPYISSFLSNLFSNEPKLHDDKPYNGHTCAIVIVGEYSTHKNDPYHLELGTYWLYQDSLLMPDCRPKDEFRESLLCGNMINIIHKAFVLQAYDGEYASVLTPY
ncbi:hypothetical protein LIER_33649 [Lithospermum erythrorhizon]|uniref:Uncharacterized protein n=1 Tax=Lithospermum erythrorhizon TaxID=34254 RepID=A0AAV3PZW2_LITER